jgi:hypothetical protein
MLLSYKTSDVVRFISFLPQFWTAKQRLEPRAVYVCAKWSFVLRVLPCFVAYGELRKYGRRRGCSARACSEVMCRLSDCGMCPAREDWMSFNVRLLKIPTFGPRLGEMAPRHDPCLDCCGVFRIELWCCNAQLWWHTVINREELGGWKGVGRVE